MIEVTRVEKATNDLKAEYFIYTNYLFDVTEVTFQLPYRDWLKLEKSEVLKNLDEYLSEVQKPYRKIYRQDQLVVMEKVVYKNPLSALSKAFVNVGSGYQMPFIRRIIHTIDF